MAWKSSLKLVALYELLVGSTLIFLAWKSSDPVHVGHTFNDLKLYIVNLWMKLPQIPFTLAILSTIDLRSEFLSQKSDPVHVGHFWMKLSPQTPFTLAIFEWSCLRSPSRWPYFQRSTYVVNFCLRSQIPFTLAIFEWSCRLRPCSHWPFLNQVVSDPLHVGHTFNDRLT